MSLDNITEKKLTAFKDEIQGYVGEEGANFALRVIAHLSIVGKPILDLLEEVAQKRVRERLVDVLTEMDGQLRNIDQNKVSKEYFQSEEFQTLLTLTIEQLGTTHDKEKQRMLASALANSVVVDFSGETRKELFLRILRDLAPEHVQVLRHLTVSSISEPDPEELAILQPLVANGLVNPSFRSNARFPEPRFGNEWSKSEAERAIKQYVRDVLGRTYTIAGFGVDFMNFLSESQSNEPNEPLR
jgi:hypothetical protein